MGENTFIVLLFEEDLLHFTHTFVLLVDLCRYLLARSIQKEVAFNILNPPWIITSAINQSSTRDTVFIQLTLPCVLR